MPRRVKQQLCNRPITSPQVVVGDLIPAGEAAQD